VQGALFPIIDISSILLIIICMEAVVASCLGPHRACKFNLVINEWIIIQNFKNSNLLILNAGGLLLPLRAGTSF
jgi:hypothetical protein